MKRLLLYVYNKLRRLRNKHRWYKECKSQLRKINSKHSALQLKKESSFLIILPHADDEWIGCGSLISSPNYKVCLCNADMEGGDTENIHLIRRRETEALAGMYNRPIHILGRNKVDSLKELLEKEKPDVVFVPYMIDWHKEHIEVLHILKRAIDELCVNWKLSVGMYQVTVPIDSKNITHVGPIEFSQWHTKWKLFREVYKTQSTFPWYRVSRNEIIQGKRYACDACEVYCIMDYQDWIQAYIKHLPNADIQQSIRSVLSSIDALYSLKQPSLINETKNPL